MRIYENCYELMSETGRNLYEMGQLVSPKSYQNINIESNPEFVTKELICQQNCLTSFDAEEALFAFDYRSRGWVECELEERLDRVNYPVNPGKAWELRKDLWEQFLRPSPEYGVLYQDYTYNERICYINHNSKSNLDSVIDELERNPDTRQAILPMFSLDDPAGIGGKRRIPCSMYYNFLVRDNQRGERVVHICYHQRSCDFITHFGNDVWLAWKLMEYIADTLGYKPGYLYHTIDSLHSYAKDWDKLKTPVVSFL